MKYIDSVIADIPKVGIETYNDDNEIDYVIDTRKLLEYLKPYEVEIPKEYKNDYNGITKYLVSLNVEKEYEGCNTYNWNGRIMHDLNYTKYKIDNKYYYVVMVHRGGDIRANYTDYFMLRFDDEDEFMYIIDEICREKLTISKEYNGKHYSIDISPFSEIQYAYCWENGDSFEVYAYNDTSFYEEIDKYYNESK